MRPLSQAQEVGICRLTAADAAPVLRALAVQGGVLAMLTQIDGRFYRPLGAVMAFLPDGTTVGQLSGGCIEGDLAHHAARLPVEEVKRLRYGRGSPFVDIRLPCGSGIDVTLTHSDQAELAAAVAAIDARKTARMSLPAALTIDISPPVQLALFGAGAEADQMAVLAHAAGFQVIRPSRPTAQDFDAFTAVALFFHDHHKEVAILKEALASDAFWIGAQGSQTAQGNRRVALAEHGVSPRQLARVHGPIGLIPKARDPHMLAISVLAEIAAAHP